MAFLNRQFIVFTLIIVTLVACAPSSQRLHIIEQPLPYQNNLGQREALDIDIIVIHATETPTLGLSREFGERVWYSSGTGNSGHYYIDRDGSVYQYVSDLRIAHHVRRFNQRSIGIEIINAGRYPNWYNQDGQSQTESYTDEQINSLIKLVNHLHHKYPHISTIAGHEDLDPDKMTASDNPHVLIDRKVDPGPLFPWHKVMKHIQLVKYQF